MRYTSLQGRACVNEHNKKLIDFRKTNGSVDEANLDKVNEMNWKIDYCAALVKWRVPPGSNTLCRA